MAKNGISSLLADTGSMVSGTSFLKVAQEQPDNVQFAQDFSNLAFQFLADRAPGLMKYILGFEVVDRSDNGTRAVGIFGFKIDGNYYYVPAFFMNSQVKGINSILSKRTNSFVPLTEQWVNYIINRKANELGKEAPGGNQNDPSQMENPNFDFLRRPTVGPLGGPPYSMGTVGQKVASAEDAPWWKFSEAWDVIREDIEKRAEWDPEFKKSFAGFYLAFTNTRSPLAKEASSPVRDYIEKVGGPMAEVTLMHALRSVKLANAALEFYTGPAAFHVEKYPRENYMLRKRAEEISQTTPKVKITSDAGSEDEAREILEDGFTVKDTREPERKSDVIETDYEANFQNPDLPGIYDVLVNGGKTVEAYILPIDPMFQNRKLAVYFPSNKQLIVADSKKILCEGGAKGSVDDIYGKGKPVVDCELRQGYLFMGKSGTVFPKFTVGNVKRDKGERPVIGGHFDCSCSSSDDNWRANPNDDFTNYWAHDQFHNRDGSLKNPDVTFVSSVELADFTGRPKWSGGTLILPKDWKAIPVGERGRDWSVGPMTDSDIREERKREQEEVKYELGTLDTLSLELRKEGAAKLEIRSDDGLEYYISFDGGHYTRPEGYKQACITLVTRLGMDSKDAKRLLKKASVEKKAKCLLKLGQLVGVSTMQPREQTPEADPYTGIPTYQSPYYDQVRMPFFGNDPSVSQDNQEGENIGGDIQRQSEEGSGEADFDPEASQLAQDAAKLGQKDVFDKAAIGGLAKVYDTGAVVDSYIPEFMQSLDRIGRVLFLYYWKHNDFVARYGTDDTVEMEDVLKNVFQNLGKLTLDLKAKAVGGGESQGNDVI